MARLTFTDEQKQALRTKRFEHPHPRVQLLMEVLWLISLGETYSNAAWLAGVSEPTVHNGGSESPDRRSHRFQTRTDQTRKFLKSLGLKWRYTAAIPLPPKKTIEEHVATQEEFLDTDYACAGQCPLSAFCSGEGSGGDTQHPTPVPAIVFSESEPDRTAVEVRQT